MGSLYRVYLNRDRYAPNLYARSSYASMLGQIDGGFNKVRMLLMKIQNLYHSSNAHRDEGKFNIVLILIPIELVLEQGCRVVQIFMDSHLVIIWIYKTSMQ